MRDMIRTAALVAVAVLNLLTLIRLEQPPATYECAACGAHVLEVWHTKADTGETVHVCSRCADLID